MPVRGPVVLVMLAGCGRIWFDPLASASHDSAVPDSAPPGLIAYYPLDDLDGSSTSDLIAGNDATCNPTCPAPDLGHLGGGLRLDGIDDCLEVPDRGQLALAQVTLAVWSNVDALDTNQTQLAKRFDSTGLLNTWQLELTGMPPEQSLTTYHGGATNDYTRSNEMPRAGVWQHVVGTYDGATLQLYVDGVLVASATASQPLVYDTNPLRIGCDHNNNILVGFFRGVLDEVRIYDRVLDITEIAALP